MHYIVPQNTYMDGTVLRDKRLAAGVSYRSVARGMGVYVSRVQTIERTPMVSDRVAIRYVSGLVLAELERALKEPAFSEAG